MSKARNYMDLPTELKLKILNYLNNRNVMRCRLVCKRFVPRDIGIVLQENEQKYGISTRLNLSPSVDVDTFTSVDWNIFMESFRESRRRQWEPDQRYFYLQSYKIVQNVEEVPVSLLENINWFTLVDSLDKPPLLTNLDIENFARIKLCSIDLKSKCPHVSQKLVKMFSNSHNELTHLALLTPKMDFDCASLNECRQLEHLMLESHLSIRNIDQLPTSIRTLHVDASVDIKLLEGIAIELMNLQELNLPCNLSYSVRKYRSMFFNELLLDLENENGEFNCTLFMDICNILPSLTRMCLGFSMTHQSDPLWKRLGDLLQRLKHMETVCRHLEFKGIHAWHTVERDPHPNRQDLDISVKFKVTIELDTFRGFLEHVFNSTPADFYITSKQQLKNIE